MNISSVRFRLIALVLIAVVPLTSLIIFISADDYAKNKTEARREVFRLVQSVGQQQHMYIMSTQQLLRALTQVPDIRNHDTEACNALLEDIHQQYRTEYTAFVAVDSEGYTVCSSVPIEDPSSQAAAEKVWFERAMQTGTFAVGEYEIGPNTGEPVVALVHPIVDDAGDVSTIVLAGLNLEWMSEHIATLSMPHNTIVHVFDQNGTILSRYPEPEQWIGQPMPEESIVASALEQGTGMETCIDHEHIKRFCGYAPLSSEIDGAYITVGIPSDVAFAQVQANLWRNLIVLILAALVAIIAAWYGGKRFILQPISSLVETAQNIAAGDLSTRTHLVYDSGELGHLAKTIDHMADALQQQYAEVQQSADERIRLGDEHAERRAEVEEAVREYLACIEHIAQGNLAQRITVHHNGVIGQLGHGLNHMAENLQYITTHVQQATGNIASAVTDILAATTQQATSTSEQSAAITQTSTTVEEIKAVIVQSSQQATLMAQDSQAMLMMAKQGTQDVEKTIAAIDHIHQRVEHIAETILSLSEKTQAIGTITKTVSELADQSNMLALNAAIEAARAGEQGKSFAVVAQHVRELAERSKEATTQVQDILGDIQRVTSSAVMVTEEGTKGVEVGTSQAQKTGKVIRKIVSEVESGSQSNVEMAGSIQQAMLGLNQIAQAMTTIQQATRQAMDSTRQTEQAARNLHTLADALQQAVKMYQT